MCFSLGSPSPDRYKLGSQFDFTKDQSTKVSDAFGSPKKTFCFGAGRENFSKTVTNTTNMYPDMANPGPGTYTDGTMLVGVNARKTALKERKFYMEVTRYAEKEAIPGPGSYEDTQAINKNGTYTSSLMK